MADERGVRQRAEGEVVAQAGPGGTAVASVINEVHGRPVPVDPAVLAEAHRLLEELPPDSVPDPGGLPAGSRPLPMGPNRLLVGREEDLKALAAKIKYDANGPPAVVVYGIGGVGKTQLAGEFAHRYGRYFAGGVYWLNLSDPESIREEVAACGGARAMGLRSNFHLLPLEERVGAAMSEWHGDLPRLLVLDDCPDGPTLDATRPKAGGCRVLVTGRGPMGDPALGVEAVALEPLGRAASVRLLRAYYDVAGEAKLGEIAAELGDLPLALDLAGRYLRRYRHATDADRYLRELRSDEILSHRSLREPGEREVSPTGHDMNVARTFAVSYRRLDGGDATDRLAIRLLARVARLAPGEPIDRRLLLSMLDRPDEEPATPEAEEREDALRRLVELGLVGELESGPVRMHKLVAASARLEVEDSEARVDVERAVAVHTLGVVTSGRPVTLEPLMPHLRHVVGGALARGDEPAYPARFAMGHALMALGHPAEAAPHLESSVRHNEARLRDEPGLSTGQREDLIWLVMRQRNDLVVALERAGDKENALRMHETLLEERRNNLPQPHEDVASTLLNIGMLKRELGLLHEVRQPYEEALAIRETVLDRMGPDDPERKQLCRDLAESHSNLGAFAMDLGRPREAARSYRRAREIYEGIGETEHERYANTTMGHGAVLGLLGDLRRARDLLELALRINRRVLPKADPRTVKNLILVGALLARAARLRSGREADELASESRAETLKSARGCLEEALDVLGRPPEVETPLSAGVMEVVADVADSEGGQGDATSLREKAAAVREKVLREAEADFIGQGTEIFAARGLYDEAELYGRRALQLRRSAAADGDLGVADAEFALGRLLSLLGRDAEAAGHLEEALRLRDAILGPADPATRLVSECLAYSRGREE